MIFCGSLGVTGAKPFDDFAFRSLAIEFHKQRTRFRELDAIQSDALKSSRLAAVVQKIPDAPPVPRSEKITSRPSFVTA